MKTQFQLSLDVELKERLEVLKERSGRSIANLLSELLYEHLPKLERLYSRTPRTHARNPRKPKR